MIKPAATASDCVVCRHRDHLNTSILIISWVRWPTGQILKNEDEMESLNISASQGISLAIVFKPLPVYSHPPTCISISAIYALCAWVQIAYNLTDNHWDTRERKMDVQKETWGKKKLEEGQGKQKWGADGCITSILILGAYRCLKAYLKSMDYQCLSILCGILTNKLH